MSSIYELDGRVPLRQALPFGLQHILAMFVANITPIIILASAVGIDKGISATLIQNCMIIAGIGTLVQLYPIWRIGSRLPIVMGISFTFLSLAIVIASTQGMGTLMGAVIVGGLVEGCLGLFPNKWTKLIPHIVAATVVAAIGLSLLPIGANSFAGGQGAADFGSADNWIVGSVTLLVCLVTLIYGKNMLRSLSILVGLIAGYILALCMGMVNFNNINDMPIVALPSFMPFTPEFHLDAILAVICIHRDHRRYVGPLFGGIRQRSEEEGDGGVSGLRRYRELHLRTIWLHPYHVFLSERGSCRLVQGNQPLHNRHRSGDTDIMRTIPTDRGIIGHYPAVRSRRLHFDDVRKHCLCELWHDGTLRILTTQHDYRQSLAKHRTWIHLRSRHVQDIPRHCQHRIRTKLRCSGLFVCRSAQPRPS